MSVRIYKLLKKLKPHTLCPNFT